MMLHVTVGHSVHVWGMKGLCCLPVDMLFGLEIGRMYGGVHPLSVLIYPKDHED